MKTLKKIISLLEFILSVALLVSLIASHWDAIAAGIRACKAKCCGTDCDAPDEYADFADV